MNSSTQKLSFFEKAGYSAADAAANFVFMTMILFQLNFYTDTFGLTASAAAAILLWPRLWDAFFDPIMGVLADRTKTRWGKFRPWILWTAVPWAVVMVLAYTTPKGWSMAALIAYAGITNTLLMTLYSMNNMPYSALGGVITADLDERARLNSFRFIAVNIAQFIVGGFTLPLVAKFALGHDRAYGWQMTMTIWAALCLILFLVTFFSTKERIKPVNETKSSPWQDFADLIKNGPWKVMALMTLVHFAILSFRGALYNYYHHYADKAAMFDFVEKLGLTAPVLAADAPKPGGLLEWLGYIVHGTRDSLASSNVADVFNSVVNMVGTLTTIAVILLSASFAHRFGKKAVAVAGFTLSTVNAFAFYFLKPTDVTGMVALTIIGSIVYAPTIPLVWAIFADVADYSEWKTGRRFTGMVFATIGFALKAGLALGSASFLWLMAGLFKYDTQQPSAPEAVAGYHALTGIAVGILFAICTGLLLVYKLNKLTTIQMADELAERRKKIINPMKTIGPTIILAIGTLLTASLGAEPALKDVFKNDFLIGAALNPAQFCESNAMEAALIKRQFNTISPENILKWEMVDPQPGRYDFTLADRYVEFGEKNGMVVIGHTLVWHAQTPAWVFEDNPGKPVSREVLLARMRDHIMTVVGRYKGRIRGWDVVNEALDEQGALRPSPWRKIIGEDYLLKAFQFAHEADPAVELYYNDYSLENKPKLRGAVALIQQLQAQGVKIAAVGLQSHVKMDWPSRKQAAAAISAFAKIGVKVSLTELDVDVLPPPSKDTGADVSKKFKPSEKLDPYANGLPDAMQQQLANRYAELFGVFLKHRQDIDRVTFWGVTDGDSWLNNWPVRGRTSYPLLFDRAGKPKPALDQVIGTAGKFGGEHQPPAP